MSTDLSSLLGKVHNYAVPAMGLNSTKDMTYFLTIFLLTLTLKLTSFNSIFILDGFTKKINVSQYCFMQVLKKCKHTL